MSGPENRKQALVREKSVTAALGLLSLSLIGWGLYLIWFPLCPLVIGSLIFLALALPDSKKGRQ